jgi:hypothetical protein
VFYDQAVIRQVDVPSFSGSFGILPKHVPTLAVLKPGVVTIYEEEGSVKKIFVSSGTVTINEDNSVQVRNWDFPSKSYPIRDSNSTVHRFSRRRPILLKTLTVPQREKFSAKPSNSFLQRQQIRIKPRQLSPLKSERLSCRLRNK